MKVQFIPKTVFFLLFLYPATWSLSRADEQNIGGIVWYQRSGECRALYYQAYKMADMALDEYLKAKHEGEKKPAVVVDMDETILNNSPISAYWAKNNQNFKPELWEKWVKEEQSAALPGAIEFLNKAVAKGFEVFYVTNRYEKLRKETVEILQKLKEKDEPFRGFPEVDNDHVYFRQAGTPDNKEPNRKKIMKNYRIVLLVGDDLNDLSEAYFGKSNDQRVQQVEKDKDSFGTRYIILPNPMYGDWDSSLAYGKENTGSDMGSKRKEALKAYEPKE
jgi:5'-nucleotidase (lipoprotein e(P4) family)